MRLKSVLLLCSLSIATILGGCGTATTNDQGAQETTTVEELSQDSTQEETEAENTEEQSETDSQENTEEITDATTETILEEVENVGESNEDVNAKTVAAYQEILKAAPAIEGEHEELQDVSFGYEENQQMFGNHYDTFAIVDINQDGVLELITVSIVNSRWAPIAVYTYADGNAVLLKDPLDEMAHGTFEQNSSANGRFSTYICANNHIHSVWNGTNPMNEEVEENNAYALEGTTLTPVECTENSNVTYIYDITKENTAANVDAIAQ